ncbi:MAG: patatin-like phospholipase family protein, partial [Candidatus Binatia bacterium]
MGTARTGLVPKIGLALGGGGAAAFAEIGVVDALREAGFRVDCVAGSSAGSVVGAALAAGHLEELAAAMCRLTRRRALWLFNPVWPKRGLFLGKSSIDFVRPFIGERIEELDLPFAAIAADLETGEEVVLDRGPVPEAVRASIAIPGLFSPSQHEGRWLVDGCLVDPLPVGPARRLGADFVIAVNVLPMGDRTHSSYVDAFRSLQRPSLVRRLRERLGNGDAKAVLGAPIARAAEEDPGLFAVLSQASLIVQSRIAVARLREEAPDFLIHVPVPSLGLFDFESVRDAIARGRE